MIMSRRRPVQQSQRPDDQTPQAPKRRPNRAEREAMKEERARDAGLAMKEYEAERRAVLANTERLRALRLARDAAPATTKTTKGAK
jgi:hypothetical protein